MPRGQVEIFTRLEKAGGIWLAPGIPEMAAMFLGWRVQGGGGAGVGVGVGVSMKAGQGWSEDLIQC